MREPQTCVVCEANDGFEGNGPYLATHRVKITSPPKARDANPELLLCIYHAAITARANIEFGWGCNASLLDPMRQAEYREIA